MIGTRLGCWVLERELGRGGMGTVYLARRDGGAAELPPLAAVKVLAPPLNADPGFLARFLREIEVLGKLKHPHIVRLLGAGDQEGRHYYAMEFVEGPSLERVLAEQRRLPWPEVLDLALQVCLALKHAHDHGIIHRDLKPSNLLRAQPTESEVGRFGLIKLTDFGIAWVFAGEHLTVTGAIVGTAEYLSPEQAASKIPTKRSDLYSLGAVLYCLLTGEPPFTGEVVDVLHKQRYGQFEKPSRLVDDLPHDFEQVICDLLEKDPDKRPADAVVLHRRLDSLRRKYDRKMMNRQTGELKEDTAVEGDRRTSRAGPATLVAQIVRDELNLEKQGGPIQRFFNHPIVVLVLFLLTVGLIVWAFLPPSKERQFARAADLMQSEDPRDWDDAMTKYLEPLSKSHPDFRTEEVEALIRKAKGANAARRESRIARLADSMSEAHWFYEKGLRLRQQGRLDEAKVVWQELIDAFGTVDSEKPWVEFARVELSPTPSQRERPDKERWLSVRAALEEANRLEQAGQAQEAQRIRKALKALYKDDPSARTILNE